MSHVWPSETGFERVDLHLKGQGSNFCETELAMWGHRKRRVFTLAEPLLSSTKDEVRRLLLRAKNIAEALDRPVAGWMSDKQDAFVQGIAAVFPGTPHGYCQNHFLRDVAKPVLEADSHAKVQMRRKVRGLRSIEQTVLREGGEDRGFRRQTSIQDAVFDALQGPTEGCCRPIRRRRGSAARSGRLPRGHRVYLAGICGGSMARGASGLGLLRGRARDLER